IVITHFLKQQDIRIQLLENILPRPLSVVLAFPAWLHAQSRLGTILGSKLSYETCLVPAIVPVRNPRQERRLVRARCGSQTTVFSRPAVQEKIFRLKLQNRPSRLRCVGDSSGDEKRRLQSLKEFCSSVPLFALPRASAACQGIGYESPC